MFIITVSTVMVTFAICLCRSASGRSRFWPIAIAYLLLQFILVGLTTADKTNFRRLKLKHDVSALPSNHGALNRTFIKNGSDSDSDDDSDEDNDDDNNNDSEDENERIQNAIVGAVPAVLGLLAVIILCIFMLCGRNRARNEGPKCTNRNEERQLSSYASRGNQIRNRPAEVGLSMGIHNDDEWLDVYQGQTPAAVHSPAPGPNIEDDLPPSYDEVMRSTFPTYVRPVAVL